MVSVLPARPFTYTVPSECRGDRRAFAVHEPNPAGRSSRTSSTRTTAPQRPPYPSAPQVRLHLKPGQKGTKGLLAQYGDRLICVRYRYDAKRRRRLKTVELVVAERYLEPPPPRFAHDQIVGLQVAFAEAAVRDRVKQAGGTWNPDRRLWRLRYDRVVDLGLSHRIVDTPASNSRYPSPSGAHPNADTRTASR